MVRATKRRCFSRYEWFIPKIMLMFPSIKGVDWNTKWAVIVVNLRIQCCKFFTKHKFSPWRYSYYIVRNYYALVVLKYHIYLVICSYNLSLNIELQFSNEHINVVLSNFFIFLLLSSFVCSNAHCSIYRKLHWF